MTQSRRVVPGQTHQISRRCVQRRFLLRPCKTVNQIVAYALGVALNRHGVLLHAAQVEANHYHFQLTDVRGVLPDFERDFDQLVARALNAAYGRGEAFWCPGSYSNVELHDQNTILEKLLYVLTNVVKDGLVKTPGDWPGFRTLPEDFGTTITAKKPKTAFFGGRRPEWFQSDYVNGKRRPRGHRRRIDPMQEKHKELSRKRSKLPDEVTFEITVPPGFEELTVEQVRSLVRERLDARLAVIYREREERGLTRFMGAGAVKSQHPFASAGDTFPNFERNNRIACPGNAELRIRLIAELKAWREEYRQALEAWRNGRRRALFPYGTYWLRVFHGVRTRGSPTAAVAA